MGRIGWGAPLLETVVSGKWSVVSKGNDRGIAEVGAMTEMTVWRCEQWVGGSIKEQNLFRSEEAAREFARALAGVSPDLVFKIEPMPIEHVWN